jgi:hypothetical protein
MYHGIEGVFCVIRSFVMLVLSSMPMKNMMKTDTAELRYAD